MFMMHTHGEHVVCWVHLGLGLPGNDGHHVDLVAIALFDTARQDMIVALGGAIKGKLVPGNTLVPFQPSPFLTLSDSALVFKSLIDKSLLCVWYLGFWGSAAFVPTLTTADLAGLAISFLRK